MSHFKSCDDTFENCFFMLLIRKDFYKRCHHMILNGTTHSPTHPPTHPPSLTHSLTLTHSPTHSLTHPLARSLTRSLAHSLARSLTHRFIRKLVGAVSNRRVKEFNDDQLKRFNFTRAVLLDSKLWRTTNKGLSIF